MASSKGKAMPHSISQFLPTLSTNAKNCTWKMDPPAPGHRHLEKLRRVIVWHLTAMDQRKVLLHWDQMPAFCRKCQSPDHCRADCPDYKKWVTCFHRGGKGHVAYNCPRNDSTNKVRAVENAPLKPRKGAKENKHSTKIAPSDSKKPPVVASGGVTGSPKTSSQGTAGKHTAEKDDLMADLPQHQGTEDAKEEGVEDVDMAESTSNISSNRAAPLEKQMKKIGKTDGLEDFNFANQLAAAFEAAIGLRYG